MMDETAISDVSSSSSEYSSNIQPGLEPTPSMPYSHQCVDQRTMCSDILTQAFAETANTTTYDDSENPEMTGFYNTGTPVPVSAYASYDNQSHLQYSFADTENYTAYHQVSGDPDTTGSGKATGSRSGSTGSQKPKRKRLINRVQRKAANVRERRRMVTLNDAFEHLKTRIPRGSKDKKLSRIDTLRTAMSYITNMQKMLILADNQDVVPPYSNQYPQYPNSSGTNIHSMDRTY